MVVFNYRLFLNIMILPTNKNLKQLVLHIINAGTRFNAAVFLEKMDTNSACNEFIQCWAIMYLGMPTTILVDQGSVLFQMSVNTHGSSTRSNYLGPIQCPTTHLEQETHIMHTNVDYT